MKRKPRFILVFFLAIAFLGIHGVKGDDEENPDEEPESPEAKDGEGSTVDGTDDDDQGTDEPILATDDEKDTNSNDRNSDMKPIFYKSKDKLKCKYDKEMANIEPTIVSGKNEEECKNGYLLDLKTDQLFKAIDNLEDQAKGVKKEYQNAAKAEKLDSTMLEALLKFRGVGQRALHNAGGNPCEVPAGLQVGSYLVHYDDLSLYFVHRMKVRNSTIFRVESLHNDLYNMALHVELNLNDLQVTGSYEQLHADKDHFRFLYRPTFGIIDVLLSQVKYKVEGRYRLVQDRLYVEHIVSELKPQDVLVYLGNAEQNPVKLFELDTILRRIKVHLDHWLKDYFNDYLMFFNVAGRNNNSQLQKFDQEKALTLNEWMDQAIHLLKSKMRHTDSTALHLKVYPMRLFAPDGMRIDLGPMVVRDVDTLHRRSVATISAEKKGGVRQVDATLGFGHLEVEGSYTIFIRHGQPPLEATFGISLDGMTAHLSIVAKRGEKVPFLHFRVLGPTRTEFTTVEGSSTRHLAAYKHILETYIIALASDRMINIIENLGDFRKCNSRYQIRHLDPGQILEGGKKSEEEPSTEDEGKGTLYAIKRGDSIEVEVPGQGGRPNKKLHIKYNENLHIENAKKQRRNL